MIGYCTFLLFFLMFVWPITFVVAVIVRLTQIKNIYYENYVACDPSFETDAFEAVLSKERKRKKERTLNMVSAVISVILSVVIALLITVQL